MAVPGGRGWGTSLRPASTAALSSAMSLSLHRWAGAAVLILLLDKREQTRPGLGRPGSRAPGLGHSTQSRAGWLPQRRPDPQHFLGSSPPGQEPQAPRHSSLRSVPSWASQGLSMGMGAETGKLPPRPRPDTRGTGQAPALGFDLQACLSPSGSREGRFLPYQPLQDSKTKSKRR